MYDVTKLNNNELEKLEKRIRAMYEQASNELAQVASDYFDEFKERFAREQLAMLTTSMSKDEVLKEWVNLYGSDKGFERWFKGADHAYGNTEAEARLKFEQWEMAQIGRGERWEELRDQMAERLTNSNQIAQDYINGVLPAMYCRESNDVARIAQESAMEQGVTGIRFDLVDEHTVARLMAGSREVRPYKKIEINLPRDKQWNLTKLQNALLQGILQGDSIDKIAGRFEAVVGMNRASAIRNARTAVTGARSAGKQDRYDDLAKQGVVFTKIWVATDDERTREEHAEADGQEVDYNLPFEVGGEELMYPADPAGSPWNIYNCRCTMKTGKPQFHSILGQEQREQANIRVAENDEIPRLTRSSEDDSTFADIEKALDNMLNEIIIIDENASELINILNNSSKISKTEIKEREKRMSKEEVIAYVSGKDNMGGACVSQALAYIGNVLGYDVKDYKDINTVGFFQNPYNNALIEKIKGIKSDALMSNNHIDDGINLMLKIKAGNEYYFKCGEHASIVRISDGKYQYLDLQCDEGKWVDFNSDAKVTLIKRFGAENGSLIEQKCLLVDIEEFRGNEEFKTILQCISSN